MKLFRFLGVAGHKGRGMAAVASGALGAGIWSPIAALGLLAYSLQLEFLIGIGAPDYELVEKVLKHHHKFEKSSSFFLMCSGLYAMQMGQLGIAVAKLELAFEAHSDWPELNDAVNWLLMWTFTLKEENSKAVIYARRMFETCRWSPATEAYHLAAFLYESSSSENDHHDEVVHLMRKGPKLRRKYVGKTIFMEKFVVLRSELFFEENMTLVEPVLELFVLWNIFPMTKHLPDHLRRTIARLDEQLVIYDEIGDRNLYLNFFKGMCHRYLDNLDEAKLLFTKVVESEEVLIRYGHLPPMAALELGLMAKGDKDMETARTWLERATNNYSKYINETVVHIRAHCAIKEIEDLERS